MEHSSSFNEDLAARLHFEVDQRRVHGDPGAHDGSSHLYGVGGRDEDGEAVVDHHLGRVST